MVCKRTSLKGVSQNAVKDSGKKYNPDDFVFTGLGKKGRLQFFYRSPSSELPIRDVLGEQNKDEYKTEPHIEIGAENYITPCCQKNNILHFLRSRERYLFLFTTYKKKKVIVGYIEKEDCLDCGKHYAVKGKTKLFYFEDAYPLGNLFHNPTKIRMKKVSTAQTKKILDNFQGRRDILHDCVKEIKKLDEKNVKKNKTCKVLRGGNCKFQKNGCLRWRNES